MWITLFGAFVQLSVESPETNAQAILMSQSRKPQPVLSYSNLAGTALTLLVHQQAELPQPSIIIHCIRMRLGAGPPR